MLNASTNIRVLRDPTRGGVASALNEIAESSHVGIRIDESKIFVPEDVRGACEILGFDPLYVANEGKILLVVSAKAAEKILRALRGHPLGREAHLIGEVKRGPGGKVVLLTNAGGRRLVEMLSGEQLPRIC